MFQTQDPVWTQARAVGWSSGPKAKGHTHGRQIGGALDSVLDVMMQELADMTARAKPGDSVRIHIKITSREEAEGDD